MENIKIKKNIAIELLYKNREHFYVSGDETLEKGLFIPDDVICIRIYFNGMGKSFFCCKQEKVSSKVIRDFKRLDYAFPRDFEVTKTLDDIEIIYDNDAKMVWIKNEFDEVYSNMFDFRATIVSFLNELKKYTQMIDQVQKNLDDKGLSK